MKNKRTNSYFRSDKGKLSKDRDKTNSTFFIYILNHDTDDSIV